MEAASQILSVSFDTEISGLFWGLVDRPQPAVASLPAWSSAEATAQYIHVATNHSSQFLHFLVLPAALDHSALSFARYTVKTTGLLAIAGMVSYCVYSGLSLVRSKLIAYKFLKANSQNQQVRRMEVVVHNDSATSTPSVSRQSRPDSLPLTCGFLGGNYLRTLAKRVFSQNPTLIRVLAGDGEEDDFDSDELESTYFGPLGEDLTEDKSEGVPEENYFVFHPEAAAVPVSPADSAYTSEYETIARPPNMRQGHDRYHN